MWPELLWKVRLDRKKISSILKPNYKRLYCKYLHDYYFNPGILTMEYLLTSSSPVKGKSTARHLHLQMMLYSQVQKGKKKKYTHQSCIF